MRRFVLQGIAAAVVVAEEMQGTSLVLFSPMESLTVMHTG
jgi:hypothetical protein